MALGSRVLSFVVVSAFLWLGFVVLRQWLRHRDPIRARLVVAVGLLTTTAVLSRSHDLIGQRVDVLVSLAGLCFLGSGYAFLLLRHELIPLARWTRLAALSAVGGAVAVAGLAPLEPLVAEPVQAAEFGALAAVAGVWIGCVVEPIIRFWREARGRPSVQRARLRALAGGYALIVLVLVVGIASNPLEGSATILVRSLLVLVSVPLFYASVEPPGWLRRFWRSREEIELRRALEDLLVFTPDPETVGRRAVEWGIRLVGGDAGFIVTADGEVLAARHLRASEMDVLLEQAKAGGDRCLVRLHEERHRYGIVLPLRGPTWEAHFGIVAGPSAPFFGMDELERLEEFAPAISTSLERARLHEALQRQTNRYEMLLGALSDVGEGFCIIDDERFLYVNDAYTKITGYSSEELLRMPSMFDIVAPEEQERIRAGRERYRAGGPWVSHYETAILHKDGRSVEIEVSVKELEVRDAPRFVCLIRDITERKAQEAALRREKRALREKEERLRALASVAIDLTGRLDADELLPAIAESATRVVGCRRAWLDVQDADGSWRTILPAPVDRDGDRGLRRWVERNAARGALLKERIPVVLGYPDGTRVVPVFGVPIERGGRLIGILYCADKVGAEAFDAVDEAMAVSLAAYAAEAIAAASAFRRERDVVQQLQAVDEMKGAFLTAVSHELRTPLTTVLGVAHTLEREEHEEFRLSPEQRAEFVRRLVENATKLERLLSDLLDVDRLNRGVLSPRRRATDLEEMCRRAVREINGQTERRVGFHLEAKEAWVDPSMVERIVENLIGNAVKHTPEGSPIWVRTWREADELHLTVDDLGPGVPDELKDTVFEPFRQGPGAPAHAPGVGIGLSLVRRFAELHDGHVCIEDRPGGGARFHVVLRDRSPGMSTASGDGSVDGRIAGRTEAHSP